MNPHFTAGPHHRRAHSETHFRFSSDDLDDVVADFNFASLDLPSLSSDAIIPTAAGGDSSGESSDVMKPVGPSYNNNSNNHVRSLSVDGDLFNGFDAESVLMMVDSSKKALVNDKLADLALIDPKRAKRILANRQSAARSKERKIRYTSELEKKVQTLQNEATTLSTQVTMLQRDTTSLTSENKELKMRLQAMEQQAKLRDALNDTLRAEVQRLKIETGQMPPLNGMNYNRSLPPQQMFHHFANPSPQQQPQQHNQMHEPTANRPPRPTFMDFS